MESLWIMGLGHHRVPVAHGPGSPSSPCGSWAWLTIESLWFMGLAHHRVSVAQRKRMQVWNPKIWGSISHGDSEFFLCPTLMTRQRTSLSISLQSSKLTTSLFLYTVHACTYFLIHLWSRGRSNCCIKSGLSPLSAQFVSCSCSSWS